MTINGKEVDFRISNLKHAAAMDLALKKMGKTEDKIRTSDKKDLVTVLSSMISMFREFFCDATGEDVLADCEDLQEARIAYEEFLAEISKQKQAMLSPYSTDRIK